jgi:hypothetical protein
MHTIYDPPPAPEAWEPPKPEPRVYTAGDLAWLVALCALLFAAAAVAGTVEPTLTLLVMIGGALVILESWFTALGFLHRRPSALFKHRWIIFLAALIPWLIGLGVAATLMMGLFLISDWVG